MLFPTHFENVGMLLYCPRDVTGVGRTLETHWTISTHSYSTVLKRHTHVGYTLNVRLKRRYTLTHAIKSLEALYPYGMNTMTSRFRDVRHTFKTRCSVIDNHTRSFLDVLLIFSHDIHSFVPHAQVWLRLKKFVNIRTIYQ